MTLVHAFAAGDARASQAFGRSADAALQWHALPQHFQLENGAEVLNGKLAYETWGDPKSSKSGVTLIFAGMSSGCHVTSSARDSSPGWWEDAVGVGRPLTSDEHFIICVSNLGSCFGSTGPACVDAKTGQTYGSSFPEITIGDQARAVVHLLEDQGFDRLNAVIGLSMGGMLALALLEEYSGQIDNFINVSSALRSSPHAKIWRQAQVEMVKSDGDWNSDTRRPPIEGLQKARRLALATYTASAGLEKLGAGLDAFVDRKAQEFAWKFDAYSFVRLAEAQNAFEFSGKVRTKPHRALVMGTDTDILCPDYQQSELETCLRELGTDTRLEIMESSNGHDAFLREQHRFASRIAEFLSQ
ncbi:MAG: alpha/beta fold hydrolase [Aliishimia sp.]